MQYLAMRQQALAILNRTDCSDTLMKTFFTMGLQRIQREYRSPDIVKELVIDTTLAVSQVTIPSDWVETQTFTVTDPNGDGRDLDFLPLGRFTRKKNVILGVPVYYTRKLNKWLVTDQINPGATASVTYWPTQPPLVNDTDETPICIVAPDAVIYGALTYAADYFLDDRTTVWEGKFKEFVGSAEQLAETEEDETGTSIVSPAYELDDQS